MSTGLLIVLIVIVVVAAAVVGGVALRKRAPARTADGT